MDSEQDIGVSINWPARSPDFSPMGFARAAT